MLVLATSFHKIFVFNPLFEKYFFIPVRRLDTHMESSVYIKEKPRLDISIRYAENSVNGFNSYVSLKGFIVKGHIYRSIEEAVKLYDETCHQPLLEQQDASPLETAPVYKLNITEKNCSSCKDPNVIARQCLQHEHSLQTTLSNQRVYNAYLVKISKIEYWIFISDQRFQGQPNDKIEDRIYHILEQLLNSPKIKPEEIDLLLPGEWTLINTWSKSSVNFPERKTIIDQFEETVRRQPTAIAVIGEDATITYRQLNEQANQLAHYLQSLGVIGESLVPVCLNRSSKLIVAILGILKAGAAYVPIDPTYPNDRIEYLLNDTAASFVIGSLPNFKNLDSFSSATIIDLDKEWSTINEHKTNNLSRIALPSSLAYIIYTSGTTGRPKGVMIEHKALMDHCYGVIEAAGLEECTSFALFSPLVFDAGHSIIHSSFILGAALHVLSSEMIADGNKLSKYFDDNNIDCLKIVPSLWLSYALDDNIILAGKVMIFGGESFSPLIADKLKTCNYKGRVYNHYGPTEATIGKSIYPVNIEDVPQVVPIGKPFSNTRFYVVDQQGRQVPPGVPGELCIAGEGLARGYLNQPETTARFFVTDTFSKLKGSKMYRTGDVVKWLADGNMEYLGRKDEQVKISGHRIELGEIETVLNELPMVKQAVVLCMKNNANNNRLEAFIIANNQTQLESIKQFTLDRLPSYMVPATWHVLESFPLTINGKIDKKALQKKFAETISEVDYLPPTNHLQRSLAEIWKRIFNLERISITDKFLELGGNSLAAMRIAASIRRQLQTQVSIAAIFNHPTIELLSAYIQTLAPSPTLPPLEKQHKPLKIPLSFSQESLWFIHQAVGSLPYHLPFIYTIKGVIDKQVLNEAFKTIINRHEVLRTVIMEEDGQGYQLVMPANEWQLQFEDAPSLNATATNSKNFIKNFINKPFDLSQDVMLRAALISYDVDQHELVYVLHHIASDGWSSSIFYNELIAGYNSIIQNTRVFTNELPIQYTDFSIWQQRVEQMGIWKEQLDYWKSNLSGVTALQLPIDFKRPAVPNSAGAKVESSISNEVYNGLQALSKQQGATLFMTLASALNILLHRYTNQDDICIGTPTAGRNQQQVETLIGYFINTLVLRNEVSANLTFVELLQKVTATTLQAFNNQDVPFEKVVEVAVQQRNLSSPPLFQVMLVLQNNKAGTITRLGNATIEPSPNSNALHATSMFDATFEITDSENGLTLSLEYATSLFKPATAEKMLLHFQNLLQAIVQEPGCRIGALEMLSKAEKHTLLVAFNPIDESGFNNENILDLIEQQVAQHPHDVAAKFEGNEITYKQLSNSSDALANYLIALGIGKKPVPVCMDHSIEMLISILAILKAGGAYVPIDTEYPPERIRFIIGDINASLLLCTKENRETIDVDLPVEIVEVSAELFKQNSPSSKYILPHIDLDDIAYVIYTSGSTGQPKGTLITHKGLAASSFSRKEFYGNTGSMLLIPSFAFDSSVGVIFGTLVSGGTLLLCRHQQIKDPQAIKDLLQNTDTILCVPSYYRYLLDEAMIKNSSISNVIVAGENLDAQLVNKHFTDTNHCRLFNEYGPTEGTVWATVAEIKPGKNITIGKPVKTAHVYILNSNLQLVPEGVTGELFIGGPQVAKGYLNLAETTNEKFVADPFNGKGNNNMYRTGDMARWLPDGNIEYLGRIDDQVKIRGHRIEPSGIEQILGECKAIRQAVVVAKPGRDGNNRLVAYVIAESTFNPEVYAGFLKDRLPAFMIPGQWIEVKHFILTPNGKIDKKALPEVDNAEARVLQYVKPTTVTEQHLAEVWQQLLPVESVSIHDNFFALGGHSLLAMRLVSAIQKKLRVQVSINELFLYPTINEIGDYIDNKLVNPSRQATGFKYLVPIKKDGNKMPLYIVAGGGSTALRFKSFSEMLDEDQPVFVFQSPFDEDQLVGFPSTIEAIANTFLSELLEQHPSGKIALAGHCIGGIIAFEMARQLQAAGKKVQSLILFDTVLQEEQLLSKERTSLHKTNSIFYKLLSQIRLKAQFEYFLLTRHPRSFIEYRINALHKIFNRKARSTSKDPQGQDPTLNIFEKAEDIYDNARKQYILQDYNGPVSLFVATERYYFLDAVKNIKFKKMSASSFSNQLWKEYCTRLDMLKTEGTHSDMFNPAHGPHFSKKLQQILDSTSR